MDGGAKLQETAETEEPSTAVIVRDSFYARRGKRVFDVVLSIVLLPIILPIMAVIALGMAHKGRVIFVQERVGRGGKLFKMYKFRSMHPNAEEYLEALCKSNPKIAHDWALKQRLDPDPRVTRIGRILRRSKLDELPQIINVLRGDMSFVGPRPFTPPQQAAYDACKNSDKYYEMRPGISGMWQIDHRRDQRFVARAVYDAEYASKITLGLDLLILLRTILTPFKK